MHRATHTVRPQQRAVSINNLIKLRRSEARQTRVGGEVWCLWPLVMQPGQIFGDLDQALGRRLVEQKSLCRTNRLRSRSEALQVSVTVGAVAGIEPLPQRSMWRGVSRVADMPHRARSAPATNICSSYPISGPKRVSSLNSAEFVGTNSSTCPDGFSARRCA